MADDIGLDYLVRKEVREKKIAENILDLTEKKRIRWKQTANKENLLEYRARHKGNELVYKKESSSSQGGWIQTKSYNLHILKNGREISDIFFFDSFDYVETIQNGGEALVSLIFPHIKKQCPPRGYDRNKTVYYD